MTTVSVPNNFSNNTAADAEEVDANFAALVSYINTHCVLKDASVAFTAVPSGPASDPSSDNQLTRKAYVDALTALVECRLSKATTLTISDAPLASWTETSDANGFYTATDDEIVIPTGEAGWYAIWVEVQKHPSNSGALSVGLVGTSGSVAVEYKSAYTPISDVDRVVISSVAYLSEADTVGVTAYCSPADTSRTQNFKFGVLKLS